MGSRMLRSWIEQPLMHCRTRSPRGWTRWSSLLNDPIAAGHAARGRSSRCDDVERLLSRIAYDTVNARDCLALRASLRARCRCFARTLWATRRR